MHGLRTLALAPLETHGSTAQLIGHMRRMI